jgi:fatty acid desaturase
MSSLSARAEAPPSAPRPYPAEGTVRVQTSWIEEAKGLVSDLYERSPFIYWTDLLLSAGAAWALAFVYFTAPAWSALQIGAFVLASILFFRAGTFIHEIVHSHQMIWFSRVWNLFMGIPLLMPWIFYRNHVDHHSAKYFGTPDDGEYLPLAAAPASETIKYLAQAPLLPLFMIVRFGVLAPLSWCHRGLREWVLTYTSAAVSNPYYRKRFPQRDETHLLIVELLCFGWLALIAGLAVAGFVNVHELLMMYLLLAFALGLNWVRNLAAHGYANRGDRMTLVEQFSDSINITGQTWLTMLLFPVGLRYHALHHLFPSLPYHNLGEAHRRLSTRLAPDAPYHASGRPSYFAAVAELWQSARRTSPENSAISRWRPTRRPS